MLHEGGVSMLPQISEYYYFNKPIQAAGIISRRNGKDMVIRGMEFSKGECIGHGTYAFDFKATIGNTTYTFKVPRFGPQKPRFLRKPPVSKR
jgi:cytochrome P450